MARAFNVPAIRFELDDMLRANAHVARCEQTGKPIRRGAHASDTFRGTYTPSTSAPLLYFTLLSSLGEYEAAADGHAAARALRPALRLSEDELPPEGRWLPRAVASVELVNARGELERVIFPIHPLCAFLTPEARETFLRKVPRGSAAAKLQGLLDGSAELQQEMEHQAKLVQRQGILAALLRHYGALKRVLFALALAINALLVARDAAITSTTGASSLLVGDDAPIWRHAHEASEHEAAPAAAVAFVVLGALLGVVAALLAVLHFLQFGLLRVRRQLDALDRWAASRPALRRSGRRLPAAVSGALRYAVAAPAALRSPQFGFYLLCAAAAAVGLAYQPLVFALTLFDLVNFSAVLRSVLRAVSNKARDLLVTLAFMLIITYCFGALGLVLLREEFAAEGSPCHDVLSCWVTVMSEGMRRGDIGESLERITPPHPRYATATVYSLAFWVIVATLWLNLFFGIILDSFGELRAAESARVADGSSVCFICGLERSRFELAGVSFSHHVRHEHNLWYYLFHLVHLRCTPPTEYNGIESHVAAMLPEARDRGKGSTAFFPSNRALALRHEEAHARREREEEEARQARVDEEQRRVADQLELLGRAQRRQQAAVDGIGAAVDKEAMALAHLRRQLAAIETAQAKAAEAAAEATARVEQQQASLLAQRPQERKGSFFSAEKPG